MSSRFAPLLALGLAACWPHIPGSWKDYDDPALTGITGQVQWIEPQGGYWTDDSPYGFAWWAVLDPPAAFTVAEIFSADGTGCSTDETPAEALETFASGGSGTSRLQSDNAEIRPAWQDDGMPWFITGLSDGDFEHDASYELAAIDMSGFGGDWEGVGELEVASFVATPATFSLDVPVISDEAPGFLSAADLTFEWRGGSPAEQVWLQLTLITSNQTFLERANCVVPNNGAFTVPDGTFSQLGPASTMLILAGPVHETTGPIPGHPDAGFRMGGVYLLQGAAVIE